MVAIAGTSSKKQPAKSRGKGLPAPVLEQFVHAVQGVLRLTWEELRSSAASTTDAGSKERKLRIKAASTTDPCAEENKQNAPFIGRAGGQPWPGLHQQDAPVSSGRYLFDRALRVCITASAYLIWSEKDRLVNKERIGVARFLDAIGSQCHVSQVLKALELLDGTEAELLKFGRECLAHLYEHVLSFRLDFEEEAGTICGAPRLHLDDKAKKDGGNFYTRKDLAQLAVKQALDPLVLDAQGKVRRSDEILALRIVDPSMGGGAFLCAAADYLTHSLQRSSQEYESRVRAATSPGLCVLASCLFGVDLDPVAVELCILTLLLETSKPEELERISKILRSRVKCGNSLIGAVPSKRLDTHTKMDLWCASWFDGECESRVPDVSLDELLSPSQNQLARARSLSQRFKFFHWQLEFAEVFERQNPGFDAVIGNPPWEIHKPNSREFFQRFDPSYWQYGKQDALEKQRELCGENPKAHQLWCEYQKEYSSFRNWVRYSTDGIEKDSKQTFRYQGSADMNAYKLFLEASHKLLRNNGLLSLIVPAGIYSDLGACRLRKLFLNENRWHSIVGFENRRGLFNIHRSFKFCIVCVQKGGETETLATQFLLENPEQLKQSMHYSRDLVQKFSPSSFSIFELEHKRDLEILDRMYSNSVRLNDAAWAIEFEREYDMTNDSSLFIPLNSSEANRYVQDQYGHWLAGRWQPSSHVEDCIDTIRSSDSAQQISSYDVTHVALPLYEGRMAGQFDFSQKGWVSGKSRRAVWTECEAHDYARFGLPGMTKEIQPQYIMPATNFPQWTLQTPLKCGFLAVGSPTNSRSMIASAIANFPCGNSIGTLKPQCSIKSLLLLACLNSYVFDFALRSRLVGNNLNYFVIAQCPLPAPSALLNHPIIAQLVAALNLNHPAFCDVLLELQTEATADAAEDSHKDAMAGDSHAYARRRARAALDAALCHLYGLDFDDLCWMLRGCTDISSSNELPIKGFWRCEKDVPRGERQASMTLKFFKLIAEDGMDQVLHAVLRDWAPTPRTVLEQYCSRKHNLYNYLNKLSFK